MKVRSTSVAVLLGLALVAGCSSSSDYDAAPAKKGAPVEVPRWIRDGVRIARATKAARSEGDPASALDLESMETDDSTATPAELPSKDIVVSALTGIGLTATQAGCVYDGVSASPQTSQDVMAILDGLAGAAAAPAAGAPTTFDPASVPTLANLTPESTTRLVMAIGPCLDQAALIGLLAAGQGLGTGGTDAISTLLNSAQGLDLSQLAGFDPSQIANLVAGALGSEQVQQVQQLLAAVGTAQTTFQGNPLALLGVDITNLDLSKLTKEQMPLMVLALLQGLTTDQQGQLMKLAQVNLEQLNIKVDPDKLTPDEIGSLLLILSPLLAGAIKPTPATPGPGGPGEVYIPPGLDLSNMNPLIFLNRADVIAQFQKQGLDANVAGCIFDGFARLEPTTIAAFFSPDAAPAAAGGVLLVAVSCILQNR